MVEKILRKIAKKCIILMKINKKASKIAQFSGVISFLLRIDACIIDGILISCTLKSVISFLLRIDANEGTHRNNNLHLQCNIVLIKD